MLLTHGHLDHTFSVTPVCGARDIPAYIHPDDDGMLADPMSGLSAETRAMFGGRLQWSEPDDVSRSADGEVLRLAGLELTVDHAPGHTRGSVAFRLPYDGDERVPEVMLSGDLLFAGSIGRTDLPGGDHADDAAQPGREGPAAARRGRRPARPRASRRRSGGSGAPTPSCRASRPVRRVPPRPAGDCDPMSRPTPISGFPEWLPAERIVEQQVIDTLRRVFELHGFAPVETRAVEPLEQLLRKGEIDKEVYVLRRLQAEEGEPEPDRAKQLGLHYDLTVPFARYVLENAGKLAFPFRRYQIQKAWRGERPQEGRYREFTQADIDVIGVDTLAFHYEVEMPIVMAEVFAALPLPPMRMQVNNRKLIEGFYRGLGVDDVAAVLRTIDKLDKIGPDRVRDALVADAG